MPDDLTPPVVAPVVDTAAVPVPLGNWVSFMLTPRTTRSYGGYTSPHTGKRSGHCNRR